MRPWRGHRGLHDPLNGKRYASPLKHLEHVLHPWSAFLILPLFAFANAGVSLEDLLGSAQSAPHGIILGSSSASRSGFSPSAGWL